MVVPEELCFDISLQRDLYSVLVYSLNDLGIQKPAYKLAAAQYVSNLHLKELEKVAEDAVNSTLVSEE